MDVTSFLRLTYLGEKMLLLAIHRNVQFHSIGLLILNIAEIIDL